MHITYNYFMYSITIAIFIFVIIYPLIFLSFRCSFFVCTLYLSMSTLSMSSLFVNVITSRKLQEMVTHKIK